MFYLYRHASAADWAIGYEGNELVSWNGERFKNLENQPANLGRHVRTRVRRGYRLSGIARRGADRLVAIETWTRASELIYFHALSHSAHGIEALWTVARTLATRIPGAKCASAGAVETITLPGRVGIWQMHCAPRFGDVPSQNAALAAWSCAAASCRPIDQYVLVFLAALCDRSPLGTLAVLTTADGCRPDLHARLPEGGARELARSLGLLALAPRPERKGDETRPREDEVVYF